ncbi:MAG TPA: MarR family transcriptional regulator [Gemmatimonadaceae bacterium]|nr:MarR family transcriptional regulator [Gemmatimonadaceae bacterium]
MPSDLRDEIRQGRPFRSRQEEAYLSLVRTAAVLTDAFDQMLKPYGISGTQYNVLRILRGAGADGLCRNEVRDRLLTRMPDVTRLLDRMEEAGLVTRERSSEDRRMVTTRLTAEGQRLVDRLDDVVRQEHERLLGHVDEPRLAALVETLAAIRTPH